jgi:Cu-processing system permease protein
MFNIASLTFKGVFRDKVFRGILTTAVVFLFIPTISSLSMRQVTALALTLSLSIMSFMLLLLSIFLGGTSLWKDMERRYTFSVLSLPITRTSYILGKFSGVAAFTMLASIVLGVVGGLAVWYVAGIYPPDRPVVWMNVIFAIFFTAQKYILLIAFAFLFSTVSTSFFLPIFGTISIFFVGSASQEVYEYINSTAGQSLPALLKKTVTLLYFILPNFSAFDLKTYAIYGINLSMSGLVMTFAYFIIYTFLILTLSSIIYSNREIQ